jgi:hypothetical protein
MRRYSKARIETDLLRVFRLPSLGALSAHAPLRETLEFSVLYAADASPHSTAFRGVAKALYFRWLMQLGKTIARGAGRTNITVTENGKAGI